MKCDIVKIIVKSNSNYNCGTGFFINNNNIITAAHIIDINNKNTIYILFYNAIIEVEEICRDNLLDISILKTQNKMINKKIKCAEFSSIPIEIGEYCYTIGYELTENTLICKTGTIIQKSSVNNELFDQLKTSIQCSKGISGSPIFNKSDKLIGIITWSENSICGCANFECIKIFIDSYLTNKKHIHNHCEIQSTPLSVIDIIENKIMRLYKNVHGALVTKSNVTNIKKK